MHIHTWGLLINAGLAVTESVYCFLFRCNTNHGVGKKGAVTCLTKRFTALIIQSKMAKLFIALLKTWLMELCIAICE